MLSRKLSFAVLEIIPNYLAHLGTGIFIYKNGVTLLPSMYAPMEEGIILTTKSIHPSLSHRMLC